MTRSSRTISIDVGGPSLDDVLKTEQDLCCLDLNLKRRGRDNDVVDYTCQKCSRLREFVVKDPTQYGDVSAWRAYKESHPRITKRGGRLTCEQTWDCASYIGSTTKLIPSRKMQRHKDVLAILSGRTSGYQFAVHPTKEPKDTSGATSPSPDSTVIATSLANSATVTPSPNSNVVVPSVTPSPDAPVMLLHDVVTPPPVQNAPSLQPKSSTCNINQHGANMDAEPLLPPCPGRCVTIDDKKLCKMLEVSMGMHLKSNPLAVPIGGTIPVAPQFGKHAWNFMITLEADYTYSIRSRGCTTWTPQRQKSQNWGRIKLCQHCSDLTEKLRNMKRNSFCESGGADGQSKKRLRLTPAQVAVMSPEKVSVAVQQERHQLRANLFNSNRREQKLLKKVSDLKEKVATLEARIVETMTCHHSQAGSSDLAPRHTDTI